MTTEFNLSSGESGLQPSVITGREIKAFINQVTFPFSSQDGARAYHDVHSQRYAVTLNALNKLALDSNAAALELAANPYGMTAWLAARKFRNLTLATYADHLEQREICITVGGREHRLLEYGFNVEHEPWPIGEGLFDIVIACEIVEHLAMDPMALFAGANRVLKPGGYFFVSTPNAASIQNFLKLGRLIPAGLASQFRRPFTIARLYERHNREYSPFTIGEMMQCAGFEITLMETDSAFPVDNLGYSEEQVAQIISILGVPELRCDTVNVVGRKNGDVTDRFPASHDLYIPSDG